MKTGPKPIPFDDCYIPVTESGCWLWEYSVNRAGYGKKNYLGKTTAAHRVSWLLHKGEIPEGMLVCHTCDVPSCVNPAHLFLGTDADNMKDRDNKFRQSHGDRHYMTKLSADDVRAIRNDSRYLKYIAADYGISISHTSNIKLGTKRRLVGEI